MRRISYSEIMSPDKPFEEAEEHPSAKAAVLLKSVLDENLTKKQKCYIILYYRDGLKPAEIARRCGVNRSTVTRTLRRAEIRLEKLRRLTAAMIRLTEEHNNEQS